MVEVRGEFRRVCTVTVVYVVITVFIFSTYSPSRGNRMSRLGCLSCTLRCHGLSSAGMLTRGTLTLSGSCPTKCTRTYGGLTFITVTGVSCRATGQ